MGDGVSAFTGSVFHATQDIGVPVAPGVDEIALALTAEAYSATLRSNALCSRTVRRTGQNTWRRQWVVPDRVVGQGKPLDWVLPAWDATPPGQVLDKALAEISARYGAKAARFVVRGS